MTITILYGTTSTCTIKFHKATRKFVLEQKKLLSCKTHISRYNQCYANRENITTHDSMDYEITFTAYKRVIKIKKEFKQTQQRHSSSEIQR